MNDASNDRTIGRTNVATVPKNATAAPATTPQPNAPPAPVERVAPPSTSAAGRFEWPTNAAHYQLINRVGQGAFASVWKARIVDTSEGKEDEGVQCAIKIMDLEHVNINISGKSLDLRGNALYLRCNFYCA